MMSISHSNPKVWLGISTLGLVMLAMGLNASVAQEPPSAQHLAMQFHDHENTFYAVDETGNFTFLKSLPTFSIVSWITPSNHQWSVMHPDDIVLSPDGRHIAFTAIRHPSTLTSETALFIYTLGEPDLHQVAAPGLGEIIWSPASDAILLVRPDGGGSPVSVDKAYLFDLATDTFTPVVDEYNGAARWLPSGDTIVYRGQRIHCNAGCATTNEVFRVGLSGQPPVQLTNLATQIATDANLTGWYQCFPLYLTWSTANQRLYYDAGCMDGGDYVHSSLYSVSLSGDNRFELNLDTVIPDIKDIRIIDIFELPDSNDMLVVASVITEREAQLTKWLAVRVSSPGQWQIVVDPDERTPYTRIASLSPNSQYLAVGGRHSYFVTIDLAGGQPIRVPMPGDHSICYVNWLDDQRLFVTGAPACGRTAQSPRTTWLYNLSTGSLQEFNGGLEGTVWVNKPPIVTEVDNQSPVANAGEDQLTITTGDTTTVLLDGSGSADSDGTIVSYQWYENGELIAEGINPQVTLGIGAHSITLAVEDDDGATDEDEVVITVESATGRTPSTPAALIRSPRFLPVQDVM